MKKLAMMLLVVVGGLADFFVLEGRFMVEGGRAPWAVINDDMELLSAQIQKGIPKEELEAAFKKSIYRSNIPAAKILVEAGGDVNAEEGFLSGPIRWGKLDIVKMLLQLGADPLQCKKPLMF
ncbi:MAG: hypothetical protein GY822_15145 [Deltaproteobacteria bacterium]|nr:hypothetical protein [Deltaproteobacteria bacterium]